MCSNPARLLQDHSRLLDKHLSEYNQTSVPDNRRQADKSWSFHTFVRSGIVSFISVGRRESWLKDRRFPVERSLRTDRGERVQIQAAIKNIEEVLHFRSQRNTLKWLIVVDYFFNMIACEHKVALIWRPSLVDQLFLHIFLIWAETLLIELIKFMFAIKMMS